MFKVLLLIILLVVFTNKKLASLLASKIFFHIQSYEDSLNHALAAEELFDITEKSQYVKKLTGYFVFFTLLLFFF